jgi:hypothetical protein
LRQVAHVGAVLVHDGKPLAAVLLGAGFVHEHDARVEEAAEARDLRIDRIGDDVADAAPEIAVGHVLLAGDLLARIDVPQAELRLEASGRIAGDAPRDERLGAGLAPGVEARRRVEGGPLGEAAAVEGREIARALQVVGHDAGDALAEVALAGEIRDRDGHRLELAARSHAKGELRQRRGGREREGRDGKAGRHEDACGEANGHGQIHETCHERAERRSGQVEPSSNSTFQSFQAS